MRKTASSSTMFELRSQRKLELSLWRHSTTKRESDISAFWQVSKMRSPDGFQACRDDLRIGSTRCATQSITWFCKKTQHHKRLSKVWLKRWALVRAPMSERKAAASGGLTSTRHSGLVKRKQPLVRQRLRLLLRKRDKRVAVRVDRCRIPE